MSVQCCYAVHWTDNKFVYNMKAIIVSVCWFVQFWRPVGVRWSSVKPTLWTHRLCACHQATSTVCLIAAVLQLSLQRYSQPLWLSKCSVKWLHCAMNVFYSSLVFLFLAFSGAAIEFDFVLRLLLLNDTSYANCAIFHSSSMDTTNTVTLQFWRRRRIRPEDKKA